MATTVRIPAILTMRTTSWRFDTSPNTSYRKYYFLPAKDIIEILNGPYWDSGLGVRYDSSAAADIDFESIQNVRLDIHFSTSNAQRYFHTTHAYAILTPNWESYSYRSDDGDDRTMRERITNNLLIMDTAPISSAGDHLMLSVSSKEQVRLILKNGLLFIQSPYCEYYWTEKAAEEANRPYAVLTYSDSNEPSVCTPAGPVDSTVDGSLGVTFSWSHSQGAGMAQDGYDLEISKDAGETWEALSSEKTQRQSYTAAANTLPAGELLWRVRTYVKSGTITGEWSLPAHVIILAPPEAPYISGVTQSPRPTIRWQSISQEAFEVEVWRDNARVYRSGISATQETHFTVPVYLENGGYRIQVRVTNSYGMASGWSIAELTVNAEPPQPLTLSGAAEPGCAALTIGGMEAFLYVYLLRDGTPVARLTSGIYRDYLCLGKHVYVVRGVNEYDVFSDSEPVELTVSIRDSATLAPVSEPGNLLPLRRRRGEYITRSGYLGADGVSSYYTGREYPVFEFSEHSQHSVDMAYSMNEADFHRLEALIKRRETLCYRRKQGEVYFGVIQSLDYDIDRFGAQITATFEQCDFNERIDYEPPALGVSEG